MPARLITPRDPARSTDGAAGALVAHLHGRPWTPYQRAIGDLIGEQLPNGRYAYPVVVALVPRQTGKTTLAFDLMQGRCLRHPDYRVAYCAQTGHVTTERMGERMAELAGTPLAPRIKLRRSQGTERMTMGRGSFVKAFPPKDGALRGSALDLVVVDEPQEHDEVLGHALDQTILPTFTTRPRRQLLLIGTAGTDRSAYLARYLALARAGAAGVAVIEFGAEPDEDPTDPAVWRARHPGLAAGLTDEDALQAALGVMGPAGFAREYLNVWQANQDRVISAAAWSAIRRRLAEPADDAVVYGVDVAVDRSSTAIYAVWRSTEGVPTIEQVDYRPGTGWAGQRLADLVGRHPGRVFADSAGPVLTVVDDAELLKVAVTQTTTREYTAACAGMLDKIGDAAVWHRGDQALDTAVAGAGKRIVGDGWAWARRSSTTDVAPLVAASLAVWGAVRRRPAARPVAMAG